MQVAEINWYITIHDVSVMILSSLNRPISKNCWYYHHHRLISLVESLCLKYVFLFLMFDSLIQIIACQIFVLLFEDVHCLKGLSINGVHFYVKHK